jgi:hypothetical protein
VKRKKSSTGRRRRSLGPMMSSGKDNWTSPKPLVRELVEHWGIGVDLAASTRNTIAPLWYGPSHPTRSRRDYLTAIESDAERLIWAYCNPPYSPRMQRRFVEKCAARGRVVMLIPARTDTGRFHKYIWDRRKMRPHRGVLVDFVQGRLKFGGAKHGAPFPSMVVVFLHPRLMPRVVAGARMRMAARARVVKG